MKKAIAVLLSILLLLASVAVNAGAAEVAGTGECGKEGDNLTWTLYDDGRLVISGDGEMSDTDSSYDREWNHCDVNISFIDFVGNITSIGANAFSDYRYLKEIIIPDSVITVGDNAFAECRAVNKIVIGDSVERIGDYSFAGCCNNINFETFDEHGSSGHVNCILFSKELSLEIGNSVTSFGEGAFASNYGLIEITIPASVEDIGFMAFAGCPNIQKITVEQGNSRYSAIDNCLIDNDTKSAVFFTASAKIPEGIVETIGLFANYACETMECQFTIPEGVKTIEECAFIYSLGLSSVSIPSTVDTINESAFVDCYFLKDYYIYNSDLDLNDSYIGRGEKYCTVSFAEYIQAYMDGLESINYGTDEDEVENGSYYVIMNNSPVWQYYESLIQSVPGYDWTTDDEIPAIPGVTIHGYAGSTAEAYAAKCGMNFEAITNECSHENTEIQNAVAATCTIAGYTGDTYCLDCGELIAEGTVIAELGHKNTAVVNKKEATCTEAGYTGDVVCYNCGTVLSSGSEISKTEHKDSDFNTLCDLCGEEIEYAGGMFGRIFHFFLYLLYVLLVLTGKIIPR